MIYICAQPAIKYYAWQIDVFIHSLLKNNIQPENIHIASALVEELDDSFKKLIEKYPGVIFEFYQDDRVYKNYAPSIKPHLLKKHFQKHQWLQQKTIFLMDADSVLIKPIDFTGMLTDDIWYFSDCNGYLNYGYIMTHGEETLDAMLKTADISKYVVWKNNENSGGAQYLMKNVEIDFWKEVEDMSHDLYLTMHKIIEEKGSLPEGQNHIQIWTAEMWAMQWNAWKKGKMTLIHPELDFCWATDEIIRWDNTSIYHNAGVTCSCQNLFHKTKYIEEFPPLDLEVDKERCSYNYYELLKTALKT